MEGRFISRSSILSSTALVVTSSAAAGLKLGLFLNVSFYAPDLCVFLLRFIEPIGGSTLKGLAVLYY